MELTHCLKHLIHTVCKNQNGWMKVVRENKQLFYPLLRMNFSEQQKDYYKLLGVAKTATESELKSAYTKLSKKYHPDMNKEPDANARFAEINNAYDTLRDPDKRKQYDRTGDPSQQFYETSSGNPFSGFSQQSYDDIFSNIFGQRQRKPRDYYSEDDIGSNLQLNLKVKFEEAALGAKIPTRFQRIVICKECQGKKSRTGGKGTSVCNVCQGRGVRISMQGNMIMQSLCSQCSGTGTWIADPCPSCTGKGRVIETVQEQIDVPSGIDNGQHYKFTGRGNHGLKSKGDLFVIINVMPSSYYQREGFDVFTKLSLKLTDAIFGTNVKVKTLHGEKEIQIPQGSQFGQKIKIPNYGIQKLNQKLNNRGDHYVNLNVEIPKKLSKKQKALYEELRKLEEKESKRFS